MESASLPDELFPADCCQSHMHLCLRDVLTAPVAIYEYDLGAEIFILGHCPTLLHKLSPPPHMNTLGMCSIETSGRGGASFSSFSDREKVHSSRNIIHLSHREIHSLDPARPKMPLQFPRDICGNPYVTLLYPHAQEEVCAHKSESAIWFCAQERERGGVSKPKEAVCSGGTG